MNKEQLLKKYTREFGHVAPNEEQIPKIEKVRESYKQLLSNIIENCPLSNDLTEAIKFLDISRMIAVKSIVMEEREKEWKNIYTCDKCFKDTHEVTYIAGENFQKGKHVCDDCLKKMRQADKTLTVKDNKEMCGKYICETCGNITDTITNLPGTQFKKGICNNCLEKVKEVIEKEIKRKE